MTKETKSINTESANTDTANEQADPQKKKRVPIFVGIAAVGIVAAIAFAITQNTDVYPLEEVAAATEVEVDRSNWTMQNYSNVAQVDYWTAWKTANVHVCDDYCDHGEEIAYVYDETGESVQVVVSADGSVRATDGRAVSDAVRQNVSSGNTRPAGGPSGSQSSGNNNQAQRPPSGSGGGSSSSSGNNQTAHVCTSACRVYTERRVYADQPIREWREYCPTCSQHGGAGWGNEHIRQNLLNGGNCGGWRSQLMQTGTRSVFSHVERVFSHLNCR